MNENIEDNIPSAMDLHWIESFKNLSKSSIKAMEEGAKGLLTACSLLVTVYIFFISSYLKISIRYEFWDIVLYCLPILLLILSIITGAMVFYPNEYKVNLYSPQKCKKIIEHIGERKKKWMRWSLILLALGGITLILVIVIFVEQIKEFNDISEKMLDNVIALLKDIKKSLLV